MYPSSPADIMASEKRRAELCFLEEEMLTLARSPVVRTEGVALCTWREEGVGRREEGGGGGIGQGLCPRCYSGLTSSLTLEGGARKNA